MDRHANTHTETKSKYLYGHSRHSQSEESSDTTIEIFRFCFSVCVCSCACPPWSLQFLVTVFTFLSLILYIDFLFQIDSAREFMQFPYLVDCLQELLGKWRAEVLCIDHGTQVSDNVCLCLDQLSVDVLLHWASELLGIVNLGGSMSNATFYCITN